MSKDRPLIVQHPDYRCRAAFGNAFPEAFLGDLDDDLDLVVRAKSQIAVVVT